MLLKFTSCQEIINDLCHFKFIQWREKKKELMSPRGFCISCPETLMRLCSHTKSYQVRSSFHNKGPPAKSGHPFNKGNPIKLVRSSFHNKGNPTKMGHPFTTKAILQSWVIHSEQRQSYQVGPSFHNKGNPTKLGHSFTTKASYQVWSSFHYKGHPTK
jgi:hypothetical protein